MGTITEQFAGYDSPFLRQLRKEQKEQREQYARELSLKSIHEKLTGLTLTADEAQKLKTMIDCRVSR